FSDIQVKPITADIGAEMVHFVENPGFRNAGDGLTHRQIMEKRTSSGKEAIEHEEIIDGHGNERILVQERRDLWNLPAHGRKWRECLNREPNWKHVAKLCEADLRYLLICAVLEAIDRLRVTARQILKKPLALPIRLHHQLADRANMAFEIGRRRLHCHDARFG